MKQCNKNTSWSNPAIKPQTLKGVKMSELRIKWSNGWITTIIRATFEKCIQAAAREAKRLNMTYEIIN